MEKDTRKLLRVYIKPETEPEIVEWAENQQNVGISIKTLIRMAIALQGTGDVLTLPFGLNALNSSNADAAGFSGQKTNKYTSGTKDRSKHVTKSDDSGLDDIRNAYFGSSNNDSSDSHNDDMDILGEL